MTLDFFKFPQLLKSHLAKNVEAYRHDVWKAVQGSLFAGTSNVSLEPIEENIIWATDSYEGYKFGDEIPHDQEVLEKIVPRIQKSKVEQKKRTKEKAEVFTPSWVCNLQNNLIDEGTLGKQKFNQPDPEDRKKWIPVKRRVFRKSPEGLKEAVAYIVAPRLEITCGEGPYICSPYDTTTGEAIPVRSARGFERIGFLDRKLRVVTETTTDKEQWEFLAMAALKATYGYEWQGDNLYLARCNVLQTYRDFYVDALKEEPSKDLLKEVAEQISWQLWQMDGLTFGIPGTEGSKFFERKKLKASAIVHPTKVPVIPWGNELKLFEDFLN